MRRLSMAAALVCSAVISLGCGSPVPSDTTPPLGPTELTATRGSTMLFLRWRAPDDTDGFHVRRSTTSAPATLTEGDEVCDPCAAISSSPYAVTNPDDIEFTDPGLTNGVEYFYSVWAYDHAENHSQAVNVQGTPMQFLDAPRSIAGGFDFSLAVSGDGTLWSWGDGSYGKLGQGAWEGISAPNTVIPTQVATDTDWQHVAGGDYFSAATKTGGTLWFWGYDTDNTGIYGPGTTSTPVQVGADTDWVGVRAGHFKGIAKKSDGSLHIFGSETVTPVSGDVDWTEFHGGRTLFAAVKSNGTLWTWSLVGNGTGTELTALVQAGIDTDWVNVACGDEHVVARKADGTVWAWGRNSQGQLGDGTTDDKAAPVQVGTDNDWARIAAGSEFTLAIKNDGSLWGWGYHSSLAAADPSMSRLPVQIGVETNWSMIAGGRHAPGGHGMASKTDGTVWAWGSGSAVGFGGADYLLQVAGPL